MKKQFAIAVLLAMATTQFAHALTLSGSVEKNEVVRHKTFFERLFAPTPEGRIGVRISTTGNIGYVHPGSPADKAGLKRNDLVLTVDGRKHAIDDISGDPGSKVHLEVKRRFEHFAVDIERIDYHQIAN